MKNDNIEKVLMVAMFPPPYSSGERIANETVKKILENNFIVDSINVSTGKLNSNKFLGRSINQLRSICLYAKAFLIIRSKVKKQAYKYFYFVTPSSTFGHIRDSFMVRIVKKRVSKIYAFIHNGNFDRLEGNARIKKITNRFVNDVDQFVFLSNGLLKKSSNLIPARKSLVIPNSISPEVICDEEDVKQKIKSYSPDKICITYMSNMHPTKGYMDVANAIKILVDKGYDKNIRANFIGDWLSETQMEDFKKFLSDNKLENVITITGKVSDRKLIKKYLLESSFFVLPTYFSHEAQPLCILEALNAGTPVISTSHASIPEYITSGYNGILVNKQSPLEIANAIELYAVTEKWSVMADNAYDSFQKNFSYSVYKNKILSLFS